MSGKSERTMLVATKQTGYTHVSVGRRDLSHYNPRHVGIRVVMNLSIVNLTITITPVLFSFVPA